MTHANPTPSPQGAQLKRYRRLEIMRDYSDTEYFRCDQAAERIATLEREKESALAELEKWVTRADNFSLECQEAEQQRDAAVRDAERYRAIRERKVRGLEVRVYSGHFANVVDVPVVLDQICDASIKEKL